MHQERLSEQSSQSMESIPEARRQSRTPILWLAAGLLVFILIIAGYWISWTGFDEHAVNPQYAPAKTLWDWLQLLGVPVVLAAVGLWFNYTQKRTEIEIANQAREQERKNSDSVLRETALQVYIDRMSELLLEKQLASADPNSEVSSLARVRTLTLLFRLEGDARRKATVLRFLQEAQLIYREKPDMKKPNILLRLADFSDVSLRYRGLTGLALSGVIFRRADIRDAVLDKSDLRSCKFQDARLEKSKLRAANMDEAVLRRAHLEGTDLTDATLRNADLSACNLTGATVTPEQLAQASSLVGTILPDGARHE